MKSPNTFIKVMFFLMFFNFLTISLRSWIKFSSPQENITWLELAHRPMAFTLGLLIFLFYLVLLFIYKKRGSANIFALWSVFFSLNEFFFDARSTLWGLHQLNSFALTGALSLTLFSFFYPTHSTKKLPSKSLIAIFFLIVVTGAWAALSATTFPSNTLTSGALQDFSKQSFFLVRLRIAHPVAALIFGGGLSLFFFLQYFLTPITYLKNKALVLSMFLLITLLFGVSTLHFSSPIWMTITHQIMAHGSWVFLLFWIYVHEMYSPSAHQ